MYIYWLSCGEHLIKGAVKSGNICSYYCVQVTVLSFVRRLLDLRV